MQDPYLHNGDLPSIHLYDFTEKKASERLWWMMPVESPEEGARVALAVEATLPLAVVSSAPNAAVLLQDTLGWISPCNHSKETLLLDTLLPIRVKQFFRLLSHLHLLRTFNHVHVPQKHLYVASPTAIRRSTLTWIRAWKTYTVVFIWLQVWGCLWKTLKIINLGMEIRIFIKVRYAYLYKLTHSVY